MPARNAAPEKVGKNQAPIATDKFVPRDINVLRKSN